MKRKIAAILAADVAGYSKMIAEDEEDTLRRLASYRAVMDDFITRAGGRVFNTAGDAVLAEFPSAVEAVRCAIDIQESLRSRNLAYPASRQMNFRIGITVGDVVERDGDLLGDGVNIAARLEGLAEPGGICVSRSVHEQVASKLSVEFTDIGEQQVKNIPRPVHAYAIPSKLEGVRPTVPAQKPKANNPLLTPAVAVPAAVAVLAIVAVAYLLGSRGDRTAPPQPIQTAAPAVTPAPAPAVTPAPAPAVRQAQALIPDLVPYIQDRFRLAIRNDYLPAANHKALAISTMTIGFVSNQPDEETAKAAALQTCQARADQIQPRPRRCEIYAVGDTMVFARGLPPLPPPPWLTRDPAIEKPFAVADVPMVRDSTRDNLEKNYVPRAKPKALALSPSGIANFYWGQSSLDEAMRRTLEVCGSNAGVPCMIVAVDDVFVVPLPTAMKVAGFLSADSIPAVAPELRADTVRRLRNAQTGWSALAAGASGRPGVTVRAGKEQEAIEGALADCAKQDRNCRVIAIGPFTVQPK